MASGNRKQYIAGVAMILAALAFIVTVFFLLGRTDMKDLSLAEISDERFGWRYEVLTDGQARTYEPRFEENGYRLSLPEGAEAVRITRVMTEYVPDAELEWTGGQNIVEVSLDGELLFSGIEGGLRDDDGFLRLTGEERERFFRNGDEAIGWVRMSLPPDYLGKELSVTTYFPENETSFRPVYPILGNADSYVADSIVFSVKYDVTMTIYALLALALAGIYLVDVRNNGGDGRTMLLCLYFLLLFLNEASGTYVGYYSVLGAWVDMNILHGIYMAPLYLYLALRTTRWWKWPLCGGIAVWTAYETAQAVLRVRRGLAGLADSGGLGALLVLLSVAAAFCAEALQRGRLTRRDKKRLVDYGCIAAAVAAAYIFGKARVWGGLGTYLQSGIWEALRVGNCFPVVSLVTDVISYVAAIAVVTEVVRRTVQTGRTMDVLRERSRLTMEGYERMLRAEEATNAAKHEMRHHMTALGGILRDGDADRAREYVLSVTDDLDRLPTMRYSSNVLVNTIAGAYLDQAKAQGIRVEYNLKVPAELAVEDEDLSVFLTNMLENALQAGLRTDPARDRYIRLNMAQQENFLFIGCANSAPEEQEAERQDREERAGGPHGYGLEAMRQIAEKYNSILRVERTDGVFSVKSNFSLASGKAGRASVRRGQ